MGALYQNVCYPDQATARAQACSGFEARSVQGGDLYTAQCTSTAFDGATMDLCKRTNGSACTTVTQPWPQTPECSFEGGVSLSYDYFLAAIAFLVIVWGGKKLIQLFDNNTLES